VNKPRRFPNAGTGEDASTWALDDFDRVRLRVRIPTNHACQLVRDMFDQDVPNRVFAWCRKISCRETASEKGLSEPSLLAILVEYPPVRSQPKSPKKIHKVPGKGRDKKSTRMKLEAEPAVDGRASGITPVTQKTEITHPIPTASDLLLRHWHPYTHRYPISPANPENDEWSRDNGAGDGLDGFAGCGMP
jgi:hypothetical protein